MTAADIIAALDFPESARINRRIPKKLLVENGATTAADKRRINERIEEIHWIAALKPANIGVPEFRDKTREYLEIEILHASLPAEAQTGKLEELIHRAIPYPIFLIATQKDSLTLSLAHKRWSQNKAGATILDGTLVSADPGAEKEPGINKNFLNALAIAKQPRTNLFALYQRWIDTIFSLLAAGKTRTFLLPQSPEQAEERRIALEDCARFDTQISTLRAAAAKERQLARKVELNLELKLLEKQRSAAKERL
jgi:hypothetical protein